MRRWLPILALYVALSVVAGFGLLVTLYPWMPDTIGKWVVLFLGALPIVAGADWMGEKLLIRNSVAAAIERRTRAQTFSWSRVGYVFLAMLVLLGLFIMAASVVSRWTHP